LNRKIVEITPFVRRILIETAAKVYDAILSQIRRDEAARTLAQIGKTPDRFFSVIERLFALRLQLSDSRPAGE
jgi:hypothetical protein